MGEKRCKRECEFVIGCIRVFGRVYYGVRVCDNLLDRGVCW